MIRGDAWLLMLVSTLFFVFFFAATACWSYRPGQMKDPNEVKMKETVQVRLIGAKPLVQVKPVKQNGMY